MLKNKNTGYRKKIYNLKEISIISCLWIFAAIFFVFLKINDLPKHEVTKIYHLQNWISPVHIYIAAFFLAGIISIPMAIMHLYIYPRKMNFIWILQIRLLTIFFVLSFICFIFYYFFFNGDSFFQLHVPVIYSFAIFAFLIEGFITITIFLKRNLGVNFFADFFASRYLDPTKEERVFLFLDMIDSTKLLHQLGSYQFSELMQDCFSDLSDVVLEYNGFIYQFVGDEAVINWKVKSGYRFKDSIDFYFTYMELLESKQHYYHKKYGIVPKFRASVNSGKVIIALVGDIKREIAYYGNVLNTCSRLQKVMNTEKNQIIISENFYQSLIPETNYTFTPLSGLTLKGIPEVKMAYLVDKKEN